MYKDSTLTHNTLQHAAVVGSAAPTSPSPPRLDEDVISFATDLFSALAHPTRLRIVELLSASERTVNEIAHELDILQPNTSQHLAILQRAGVVHVTPRGALRSYSIRAPRMNQILLLVDELRSTEKCEPQQIHSGGNANSAGRAQRFTLREGRSDGNGRAGVGNGVHGQMPAKRHGNLDDRNRSGGNLTH